MQKISQVVETFITTSDAPFFLMVSYPDTHLPFHRRQFVPPEKLVGIDTPRLRTQTVDCYSCRLDSDIGLLLDCLQHSGTADNTIAIFTTDQGAQFSRGETAIYEGGLKIPLILRGPTIGSDGLIREELVSLVDVLPTVMGLAGIDYPDSVAGQSLIPLIQESMVVGANTCLLNGAVHPLLSISHSVRLETRNSR